MKIFTLSFFLLITFLSCKHGSESSLTSQQSDGLPDQKDKIATANIVFRSADGGQTWQDISKGLPSNLQNDGIRGDSLFVNDKGLVVRVANELYRNTANATPPFWNKEIFLNVPGSPAPGKPGMLAGNHWGIQLKKANETSVWSPIFDSSSEPRMRSVFETAGSAIFIGTDKGLFKTADNGQTWKHVYAEGWAGNMAESDGVLLSTSKRRLIRSADDGENWTLVTPDIGITWDVKQVRAGFAAISSGSASDTRKLKLSYDGGKTWQPSDAGHLDQVVIDSIWRTWDDRPRVQAFQTSIIQVGENYVCSHPDGIFRSADNGKTWRLLLPSKHKKAFNLFVFRNMIYAIFSKGGC
jgi:photosystem II stability/assembly factor-like uncharacterized protein